MREGIQMDGSKKRIVVIGSGITGLTAAYRIKKRMEKEKLPFELFVLEGSVRSGGNILTTEMDGLYFDVGAESIEARVTGERTKEFIDELGLSDQIEYSVNGKPDIFAFNQLYSIDAPTYKGIPLRRGDIWKFDILSLHGKLSYLKNTYLPSDSLREDMDTRTYLRDHLGEELFEYVVEPFITKEYFSDIDEGSLHSLEKKQLEPSIEMEDFVKIVQEHPEWVDGNGNEFTFKNGLETLIHALVKELSEHIQYVKQVTQIKKSAENTYILDINNKEQMRADTVVVATDLLSYEKLFSDSEWSKYYQTMQTGSIGYMLLAFSKGAIKSPLLGYGLVSPRRNDSYISKVTWLNKKWRHLKKAEKDWIGVHFGRMGEDNVMSLSNNQLVDVIRKDLKKMLGIEEVPLEYVIKRWTNVVPRFAADHEERKHEIDSYLQHIYPGVFLAGNGLEGFGIHFCIQQGEKVGNTVIEYLKNKNVFYS